MLRGVRRDAIGCARLRRALRQLHFHYVSIGSGLTLVRPHGAHLDRSSLRLPSLFIPLGIYIMPGKTAKYLRIHGLGLSSNGGSASRVLRLGSRTIGANGST